MVSPVSKQRNSRAGQYLPGRRVRWHLGFIVSSANQLTILLHSITANSCILYRSSKKDNTLSLRMVYKLPDYMIGLVNGMTTFFCHGIDYYFSHWDSEQFSKNSYVCSTLYDLAIHAVNHTVNLLQPSLCQCTAPWIPTRRCGLGNRSRRPRSHCCPSPNQTHTKVGATFFPPGLPPSYPFPLRPRPLTVVLLLVIKL